MVKVRPLTGRIRVQL